MHGGGYLGAYSGRIDHAWGARSDAHASLPKPPTEYLKKIYFDTVVFTPIQLEALVKTFGADHVVLGTDYPFDMADFDPIEHVVVDRLRCRRPRRRSAGGNAKKIVGALLGVEEIQTSAVSVDHRLRGAVAPGVGALLRGLRRLQIGAEMARALDDAAADGQPLRLEARAAPARRRRAASASASASASSQAFDTPAPTCGRATNAASPMIATRPNAMRGVSRS